jgi:hypothetical protein
MAYRWATKSNWSTLCMADDLGVRGRWNVLPSAPHTTSWLVVILGMFLISKNATLSTEATISTFVLDNVLLLGYLSKNSRIRNWICSRH